MMAWARTGPIPGRLSSSSLLAVLRSTFCPVARVVVGVVARGVVVLRSVGVEELMSRLDRVLGAGCSVAGDFPAVFGGAMRELADPCSLGAARPTSELRLGLTVTSCFKAANRDWLMPLILVSSFTLLKGRAPTMFLAVTGPTPGRS